MSGNTVPSRPTRTAPLQLDDGRQRFVLTGAGISAESGIRTFRDSNGLWEEHRVEDVATPAFDEVVLGKAGDLVPALFQGSAGEG